MFLRFFGIILIFLSINSYSQLVVDSLPLPEELVNDYLIGDGISVFNITYTGDSHAIGAFNGATNIGLSSGILLTSGFIKNAVGPNNVSNAGQYGNTGEDDADLDIIATVGTQDACILEFDFISTSDTVEFTYVFASEEYHEFVDGGVNDVFGFFISGPGINGPYSNNSENIAVVPGTNTPVSINTINNGTTNTGPCDNCGYFVNNTENSIQYDAFTTVLTAQAVVTPCQTYHIKLAIADGLDDVYDSGVFLGFNSFSSNSISATQYKRDNTNTFSEDSICIEGCTQGGLAFTTSEPSDGITQINYSIIGNSDNGIDFVDENGNPLSGTIEIPNGEDSAMLIIDPIFDNISEANETVSIVYQIGCESDTATFYIQNVDTLIANINGITMVCDGSSTTLNAAVSGGTGFYSYLWSTGETTNSISVSPNVNTSYFVDVTDECGNISSDTIIVTVGSLVADAGIDTTICSGDTIQLNATGGGLMASYSWQPSLWIDNSLSQSPSVWPNTSVNYIVTVSEGVCSDTDTVTITVIQTPNISVINDTTICEGDTAQLQVNGNPAYNYAWIPANTLTNNTIQNPQAYPTNNTNYTITAENNGCTANENITVFVNEIPNIQLNVSDTAICAGDSVQLEASGCNFYVWQPIASLTNPNISNPIAFPSGSQTYVVRGIKNGCTNFDTVLVQIEQPELLSISNDTVICKGDTISLFASGGNSAEYEWFTNLGGVIDTAGTIDVYPTQSETYYVSLLQNSCTVIDSIEVEIQNLPDAVAGNDTAICLGENITISASLINPANTYIWHELLGGTIDTNQQITVAPTDTISYTLQVNSALCKNYDTITVSVKPIPNVIAGDDTTICENDTIALFGSGDGVLQWSSSLYLENINNPQTNAFPISDTEFVLTAQLNGCTNTDTVEVFVNPIPVLNNLYDTAICIGDSVWIDAGYNMQYTYLWQPTNNVLYTDSSRILAFPNDTVTYTLTASVGNCVTIDSLTINPTPYPDVSFDFLNNCADSLVLFNNTSSISSGTINAYNWYINNTPVSTNQNLNYNFDTAGNYIVSLSVVSVNGCEALHIDTISIFDNPVADFDFINSCEQSQVSFYDSSTIANGNIVSWQWQIEDSIISGTQQVDYYFDTANTYTVQLLVESNNSCTNRVIKQVDIFSKPNASFAAYTDACMYDSITFSNTTSLPQGTLIDTYKWLFDTLGQSNAENPVFAFDTSGIFTISLIANSTQNCFDTATAQITVHPTPVGSFTFSDICLYDTAFFTNTSTIASGSINSNNWSFGDNTDSFAENPSHLYINDGTYIVQLVTTSNAGCTDTLEQEIEIFPVPNTDFLIDDLCEYDTIILDNNSSIGGNDSIVQWNWNIAGDILTEKNPQYSFGYAGDIAVSLKTISSNGCVDSLLDTLTVNAKPEAFLFANEYAGCEPFNVLFTDSSNVENDSIVTYVWQFGDGASSSGTNQISYTYQNEGMYSVTLTVVSSAGCQKTVTYDSIIEVYPKPNGSFIATPTTTTIFDPLISFKDLTQNSCSWFWDFDNSVTSTQQNPKYSFLEVGTYNVQLVVTECEHGCSDTVIHQIEISSDHSIFIPSAFTPDGDGKNDVFFPKGRGIEGYKMYIYDRWGKQIYVTDSLEGGWEGVNIATQSLYPPGVYVYLIEIYDALGELHRYLGRVTLIR